MNNNIFSMITNSGPIVFAVLLLLLAASVTSWTIIFFKWLGFNKAKKDTAHFLDFFWNAKSLEAIFAETKRFEQSPVSNVFRLGYMEFQKVSLKGQESKSPVDSLSDNGLENVQRALRKASIGESLNLEKFLPMLATIASVAPFVGLFGTVWGIMTSFHSLGQGGPATLQRVAPGISEALIATAVGLGAAIPAVVAYNSFMHKLKSLRIEMDGFASDFVNILKRNNLG